MCGILGYIGDREPYEVICNGLKAVEYRGYDSVGVYAGKILKKVGDVDSFLKNLDRNLSMPIIAHTRWATHGKVEDKNAHPHEYGDVILVHNGTVDLHPFPNLKSDTDSERIAAYLDSMGGSFLDRLKNLNLNGTYALVIFYKKDKDKLYFAKKDTPLIIGIGNNEMFLSSDIAAFIDYTTKYIRLEDGDYGYITKNEYKIYNKGIEVKREIKEYDKKQDAKKGNFFHFMLKEIHDQLELLPEIISQKIPEDVFDILKNNRIDVIAAGSSYNAGLFIKYLTNYDLSVYISSEYSYLMRNPEYLLAISQSGETLDTIKAVKLAKSKGAKIISITNYLGSTLASLSDFIIPLGVGIEKGVAATKTFFSTILIGYKLINKINIEKIKAAILEGMNKNVEIIDQDSKIFFLGKGINYPIALEGALKFKELVYCHAEGLPAGEMKHGPLSLFDKQAYVLFIKSEDSIYNYEEIKARGARVNLIDFSNEYPQISTLVYFQRLAYQNAVYRNQDPDKPRFLAKSVTVE